MPGTIVCSGSGGMGYNSVPRYGSVVGNVCCALPMHTFWLGSLSLQGSLHSVGKNVTRAPDSWLLFRVQTTCIEKPLVIQLCP
jgi:hypothetical protein